MVSLFFGDTISVITTVLILVLLCFLAFSCARRKTTNKWGVRILIAILIGTALSGLSATRDAFMLDSALFAPMSMQSLLCAGVGILIYLLGISAIFVRRQEYRYSVFVIVATLLTVQIIAVEGSRIALFLGIAL